mmetsp:Transcript_17835/g.36656  ORF Transcript_17835/g.36656 Transcript_17835/m.36656 type:complete len:140 (+) Transcript_17835:111-530(+)|eukprot:CAMPEP_0201116528 /NCGR_PEP_ID=MMETSP0850-20130426/778_1 /ASSEMBLY_ACC=CAM_ASM_000622 /TAXON_ID=183588 /ORGANISM="Pseudo-nitzschia fraudulenta, Strain WWA7" /LENGTH=139 /DNA_ID=CAMNT_0047380627 /DNA_START=80 /DNA_END=499 /DNA_ORIENTATION=+
MSAQNFSMRFMLAVLAVVALASTASAFVPTSSQVGTTPFASSQVVPDISGTQLSERRWNFNEGQSPWGMKTNAETWNGRVAQIAFVWIFLQELVTGKGVLQGIDEGDWFFLLNAGLFGVMVVGLTGWLAIKGDDDYTKA